MLNQFSRTELLFGKEAMEKLADSRVAVFGIGGVGGYTVEALVRSGVGKLDLIDDDKVCLTNLNRQIIATRSTVGKYKVDVMKDRILDINPKAEVNVHKCFYLPETKDEFDFSQYDYVVDAVDTVTAKISLVMKCQEMNIPIISCMGAGNKMDPARHGSQRSRRSDHQQYGSRKQTRPDCFSGSRHLQNIRLPSGKSYAS
jgi:tRNA A37 threonylcarbamoyladenosine dehydratase